MREKTIKIFTFSELDDDSKEKAINKFREDGDLYHWHSDNQESLQKFGEFLGAKNIDFSVSLWGNSYAQMKTYENYNLVHEYDCFDYDDLRGDNLKNWLNDNSDVILKSCPLTGYCMDDDLIIPLRKCLENKTWDNKTARELIEDGLNSWVKSYISDWEYTYTDEAITELIVGNEYEFLEDGTLYF